jgi:prepilin-type processing-associated H-X9-DG protein
LLIDTSRYPGDDSSQPQIPSWQPYITSYTNNNTAARHFDGADIAFADGHVKWEKQPFYKRMPGEANYNRILPLWRKQNQAQ